MVADWVSITAKAEIPESAARGRRRSDVSTKR
jgi:hypothetical protein